MINNEHKSLPLRFKLPSDLQWLKKMPLSHLVFQSTLYIICLICFVLFVLRGGETSGYDWQWFRVWGDIGSFDGWTFTPGIFLRGLWTTLYISFFSMLLALLIGVSTALLRLGGGPLTRFLAVIYIQIIRNTPLLVQLFMMYFVIGPLFDMGPEFVAVLALGIFEGAYIAEVFRSGILAVPSGQWEAGESLGLPFFIVAFDIILPQAVRNALPALVSQMVSLVKDSSLASAIAVTELTLAAKVVSSEKFIMFETWITVAVIYLFLALLISLGGFSIRVRLNRGY